MSVYADLDGWRVVYESGLSCGACRTTLNASRKLWVMELRPEEWTVFCPDCVKGWDWLSEADRLEARRLAGNYEVYLRKQQTPRKRPHRKPAGKKAKQPWAESRWDTICHDCREPINTGDFVVVRRWAGFASGGALCVSCGWSALASGERWESWA